LTEGARTVDSFCPVSAPEVEFGEVSRGSARWRLGRSDLPLSAGRTRGERMGFSLEHAFVVKAPAADVWAYLTDPYRVAPALPGAAITEKNEDGSYGGTMTLKVGPVSARYKGTLRFENTDATARTTELVASGQDTSGRGGANLRMKSRLAQSASGETEVKMTSDVNVTGILAQFGRGMIQDVSNQMFNRFVAAVREELETPAAAEASSAIVAGSNADSPSAVRAPNSAGSSNGADASNAYAASHANTSAAGNASTASNVAPSGGSGTASTSAAPAASTSSAATSSSPSAVSVAATRKPAEPVQVVSLGAGVIGRALARQLQRPAFWIVLIVLALGIYGIWYR
jgi:uncharacterized protein